MNNKNKRAIIFKPNKVFETEKCFDINLIKNNKAKNIETSLIFDNNVVIKIEKIVKNGNTWRQVREKGLDKLVRLLQKSSAKSVCVSIGGALREMPPQNVRFARECYEKFCSIHLPSFVDTPNSIQGEFIHGEVEGSYGFDDLDHSSKALFLIHYVSFIYLNAVYLNASVQAGENKLELYLDLVSEKLNCISAMDLEIAKYCFSPDQNNLNNYRKNIRKNFLKYNDKLPKNIDDIKKIAFNATCDVHFVDMVNSSDQNGLDEVEQDTWIVTFDEKLVDLFRFFYYVNEGDAVGRIAVSARSKDHTADYWREVDSIALKRSMNRLGTKFDSKIFDTKNIEKVVSEALDYTQSILEALTH